MSPTPETATSQPQLKRKREDHVIKFDDINIGEVYTVTVKSVKQLQLNVQLSQKVFGVSKSDLLMVIPCIPDVCLSSSRSDVL